MKIVKNLVHQASKMDVKKKQKVLFWSLAGLSGFVLSSIMWHLMAASSKQKVAPLRGEISGPAVTEKVLTGVDRLNPQDAWNEKMTVQIEEQRKEIASLHKELELFRKKRSEEKLRDEKVLKDEFHSNNKKSTSPIDRHDAQPESLHFQVPGEEEKNENIKKTSSNPFDGRFRSKGITKVVLNLKNSRLNKNLETVDNTLPAGSFAQGILLSGVEASTSASSSANPEPVLIELTDSGDLSRFFKSHVKGCRITASSYGVLSKERVMMRLEKLSCVEEKTGEILTVDVDGYVSGEDGRLGMKGVVVDHAGEHIRTAMVGGFLSSFGNFLSASSNPVTFSSQTGLASVTPLTRQELLKQGLAKGSTGALDKFTEFYIKRAEQLDPVIVIAAGRIVNVVFTKSASLSQSQYRQKLSQKNDQQRIKVAENAN